MKVKELIQKLQQCDPEAIVAADIDQDPKVQLVVQYSKFQDGTPTMVYLCDDCDYLDDVILADKKELF